MINDSWFVVRGSWFVVRGSWFKINSFGITIHARIREKLKTAPDI